MNKLSVAVSHPKGFAEHTFACAQPEIGLTFTQPGTTASPKQSLFTFDFAQNHCLPGPTPLAFAMANHLSLITSPIPAPIMFNLQSPSIY